MSEITKEIEIYNSTLETVDFALYEWLNEKVNPHAKSSNYMEFGGKITSN